MSKILYFFVLLPLSKLPLFVLYWMADFVYFLFRTIWPYRKKVVTANLQRSFPDKTASELQSIQNKFYRHLADLLAESIKNLSISANELRQRMTVENPEFLHEMAQKKRSFLLIGAHYGNWEWVITSQALLFPQHSIGLGKPLSNGYLDKKINALRGRFGMDIVHAHNYKDFVNKKYTNGFAMLTLSDQSPGDSLKSYWTHFLNQPTAVLFGAEQMAHQYDLAVVFFTLNKTKRGHYAIKLELICDSPKGLPYGEITEKHTRLLEKQLRAKPEFWLWSHKRWKREIPENVAQLMEQHRLKFEKKFG
jgi:KDO2-lipid IV(A) lauroyltransferase